MQQLYAVFTFSSFTLLFDVRLAVYSNIGMNEFDEMRLVCVGTGNIDEMQLQTHRKRRLRRTVGKWQKKRKEKK